jgi:hypothetical protein
MEWANPVEWFAWIYGKMFQEHVYVGGVCVMVLFALLGLGLWVRAVDKYKEGHLSKTEVKQEGETSGPKQQTVTATAGSPASPSVTVQAPPAQGMAQQTKSQRRQKTATIPTSSVPRSSIVHNAGEIGDLEVTNSEVSGSAGEYPVIVDNAVGGKISKERVDHSKASTVPTLPVGGRSAIYAYKPSGPVYLTNAIICGDQNAVETAGTAGGVQVQGTVMNDPKICAWANFLNVVRDHQTDLSIFLAGWRSKQEASWTGSSDQVQQYQTELNNICTQLTNEAASNPHQFFAVIQTMKRTPPSFGLTPP